MSVLLYAVTDAALDTASGEGLEQRPLRTLSHNGLRAVVSDVEDAPAAEPDTLWAYHGVVTRLMGSASLLPARFATTAQSDGEITALLATRERELARALEHVRGAAEFAVRADSRRPDAPDAPSRPGTAYMRARLAQSDVVRDFEAQAGELVRARTRRSARSWAYLVDRHHWDEFENLARGFRLAITGPWPPYSFVGETG
ncbi:MAG TPA: GvpL/GvpF family gas vesicle protein [Solirubrobacteraceae bacterium]|nr:GvpL/GvpF family gas vesicle protein [Solirubrobacteraceae bacterium]